jgi:hypothetical protein
MLDHSANAGRHSLADRGLDMYETPECATRALMKVEKLPHDIWEPACGRGAIVRVLRAAGHHVYATDLVDYGLEDSESGKDFLLERQIFPDGCILTNPPFRFADRFVAHALTLCPRVIMLARLAFLESERRTSILEGGCLARVYVFKNRLPLMHRDNWAGPRSSSSMAFAWFSWRRDHSGPTELHRISWK